MDVYTIPFAAFSKLRPWPITKVPDLATLNRIVAEEITSALKCAARDGRKLMVILPVGPLDYTVWADAMNREGTDGSALVTLNMDEYLDENGDLVGECHPMSFRRFMRENFFDRLEGNARVPAENIHFPLPHDPETTTRLVEEHGGADLCYGGFGATGHFAFNDPPPPGAPCDDEQERHSRTRILEIGPESMTQMCMGGTGGNWDIIPRRAITLGMYELMLSRKIHLTFMRSWHAGVLRRALFGPVTGRCPGSFVQEHPNLEITLTDLAADLPLIYLRQSTAAA